MKASDDTDGTKKEPPDQEALLKMWAEILHISPELLRELVQQDLDNLAKRLDQR